MGRRKAAKAGDGGEAAAGRACAICGRPAVAAYRPFCSARCADVDLHRWLAGAYAVPAVEGAEDGDTGDTGDAEGGEDGGGGRGFTPGGEGR